MLEPDFEATNERVQNAFNDTENHAICMHSWEDYRPEASYKVQEIKNALGVITNTDGAHYSDRFTEMMPFPCRSQSHDSEYGMVGLATSLLHPKKPIGVYGHHNKTELLLIDPNPVSISNIDVNSLYYDINSNLMLPEDSEGQFTDHVA
jgi:hypothetical protein